MFEHDSIEASRCEGHRRHAWEPNAHAGVEQADLVGMKLADAVVVGRRGKLREQFSGGDLLGQHLCMLCDLGLRNPEGGVDKSRRVDLLGNEIGMRGVEAMQIEGVPSHRLDPSFDGVNPT